jgi:hypothetical protein
MIPGLHEILDCLPRVILTAKIQKVPSLTTEWFLQRNDYMEILNRMKHSKKLKEEFCPIFKVFLKNYNEEEIINGCEIAYRRIMEVRHHRYFDKERTSDALLTKSQKFFSKLHDIKSKREIGNYNRTTYGRINYHEGILDEKTMMFPDGTHVHRLEKNRVHIFRFKDKNGKLFLNFYGVKNDVTQRSIRRKVRRGY